MQKWKFGVQDVCWVKKLLNALQTWYMEVHLEDEWTNEGMTERMKNSANHNFEWTHSFG